LERCEPTRHLAGLAFEEGKLDQALTSALQALSLREAAGFRPSLPFDHLPLSEIYQARGDNASRKKQVRFRVRFLGGSTTSVEKVKERQSEEHV
jgi:hypothetical protein